MSIESFVKRVSDRVLDSKKYRFIYRPTVERVVKDCLQRFPHASSKAIQKQAQKRLHRLTGAYTNQPNYDRLIAQIQKSTTSGLSLKDIITPILKYQSSTNERIPILGEFYDQIFRLVGNVDSIVEYGCGLNALTYPWMNTKANYLGVEIYGQQVKFINQVRQFLGLSNKLSVELGDVLVDLPIVADLAMFLKLMPLLEHDQAKSTLKILRQQPSRFVVVSYPKQTLSGKQKGFKQNYQDHFYDLVSPEIWRVSQIEFNQELLFIVDKNP